ncbi:tRNA pseudouridine synthase A [invertebrate metagenome]|uniref:tRNA pseudouridine synthase A n=1 Tax=invertebrate metagenome TaxID=1711999 RepID=A0A484H6B4_9ZZZZ
MENLEGERATTRERAAKVLARAGLCSRREAEQLIITGRVTVNGQMLEIPATRIMPTDAVHIDGTVVATLPAPIRLWRYHKPRGLVVTHRDPEGRQTVFATLPRSLPRVVSIGRLDLTSEGLLLLTNNGALAHKLEIPETSWVRRYRVRIHGKVDSVKIIRLSRGITLDGITYGPIHIAIDRASSSNTWLTVSLCEGRNREIRRVMAACGWSVSRLIRISYGPFKLGCLAKRAVEEVSSKELEGTVGTARLGTA